MNVNELLVRRFGNDPMFSEHAALLFNVDIFGYQPAVRMAIAGSSTLSASTQLKNNYERVYGVQVLTDQPITLTAVFHKFEITNKELLEDNFPVSLLHPALWGYDERNFTYMPLDAICKGSTFNTNVENLLAIPITLTINFLLWNPTAYYRAICKLEEKKPRAGDLE
jgi:hypothetical protein